MTCLIGIGPRVVPKVFLGFRVRVHPYPRLVVKKKAGLADF